MADASTALDEENFRRRYANETVSSMPASLATIASRNLAREDATLERVNAVSRVATPFEGYARVAQYQEPGTEAATRYPGAGKLDFNAGTVTGNVPSFQTSMNPGADFGISDAMERRTETPTLDDFHVDDISQRQSAIDEQKKQIQARLGLISPREAGLAAVVLAGPKEKKDLFDTWHALETESQNLLREHQLVATSATKAAHENLITQSHIQAANGKAKIFSGLADIDEKYPKDSPEHRLAVLKLFGSPDPDIAAARGTPQFESLVRPFIDQHDKSMALAARIKEVADQGADQYYSVEALRKDHPDAEYRQDPKTGGYYVALGGRVDGGDAKIPQAAYTDLGRLNAKKASDALYLNRETDPTKKSQLQKQIDATQASIDAWHETYTPKNTPAVPAVPAVPAAAPDLKALAQKALNDPNASEAHKASARKILGQ